MRYKQAGKEQKEKNEQVQMRQREMKAEREGGTEEAIEWGKEKEGTRKREIITSAR